MSISLTGQIAEVERELGLRHTVYANQVATGKMKQALADLLIERMEAVRDTLIWLQRHEADIRAHVAAKKAAATRSEAI
jgi:hypothetical protein